MTPADPGGPRGGRRSAVSPAAGTEAARRGERRATLLAMACAGLMIAHQVGGKATRDAGFLSQFDVSRLPWMVMAAAAVSLAVVVASSRLLQRWGPRAIVPPAFVVSAVLQVAQYLAARDDPSLGVVLFYLHLASVNVVLISAFWSLVNESFDPRGGKRSTARIATAATLGGLVGGLAAAAGAGPLGASVLLVLAAVHLACAWLARSMARSAPARQEAAPGERRRTPARAALNRSSYLRGLALLVLLLTAASGLLDYAFKARSVASYTDHADLARFFGLFYTGLAAAAFAVQSGLGTRVVERLGLARAVGLLPVSGALASLLGFLVPGLAAAAGARAVDATLRSSLYRSGYEGLFNPVPVSEKRAAKPVIDVGFDRLGDAAGAGAVALLLAVQPSWATSGAFLGAAAVFLVALWVVPRLQRGYVAALASRMRETTPGQESASDSTLFQTASGLDAALILEAAGLREDGADRRDAAGEEADADDPRDAQLRRTVTESWDESDSEVDERDPFLATWHALRSREPLRVRRTLARLHTPGPEIVGHLVTLLAWNEVAPEVMRALRRAAPRCTGQLLDALLDESRDFAVRRRIPRVLAQCASERAVEGLLRGLFDARFEVRYQCGLALYRIHRLDPALPVPRDTVHDAALHAVRVGARVWNSARLIDALAPEEESPFVDDALRNRADRSLEHVFNLLALVGDPEPLTIAFRGLHTEDPVMRGTALEYLDNVLPRRVRDALLPLLDAETRAPSRSRDRNEILNALLESHDSIRIELEDIRRAWDANPGQDETPGGNDA